MGYLTLAGAILTEITGTVIMTRSEGFTRLWPTVATLGCYALSFLLLAQTLKSVEVGVAYAVWSGAGTTLIASIGIVFLGESASVAKLLGVTLVIAGVVVLNLGGAAR